jgi:hypothetical protein
VRPLLLALAVVLVIACPAAVAAVAAAALTVTAYILGHLFLVLAAELAALAFTAARIARAAGLRRHWRARRFVPWVP